MIRDGNSIFISEVGGLCIGHLGHLHHKLDESHFAAIGRLDIVMVPIDGSYTMSLDGISEITRRLRASVVLPMHRFMTPLDEFMRRIGQQFEIDVRTERTLRISRSSLPGTPTSAGTSRRGVPPRCGARGPNSPHARRRRLEPTTNASSRRSTRR